MGAREGVTMFESSMIMTIGQALGRAREDGATVEINVGGAWISGMVINADGQGVVVSNGVDEVCVVRLDAINCVRIPLDEDAFAAPAAEEDEPVTREASAEGPAEPAARDTASPAQEKRRPSWPPRVPDVATTARDTAARDTAARLALAVAGG